MCWMIPLFLGLTSGLRIPCETPFCNYITIPRELSIILHLLFLMSSTHWLIGFDLWETTETNQPSYWLKLQRSIGYYNWKAMGIVGFKVKVWLFLLLFFLFLIIFPFLSCPFPSFPFLSVPKQFSPKVNRWGLGNVGMGVGRGRWELWLPRAECRNLSRVMRVSRGWSDLISCVEPDGGKGGLHANIMHPSRDASPSVTFLPMVHNLNLIMSKHGTNSVEGYFTK